ncbi:MAG: PilN domain-containing protein [Steroidobacteraceae bacterium]
MPRINLLPWREEQRKERKLAFLVALGAATVAALVVTFIVNLFYGSLISGQESRNERLNTEIRELDKQIEKINSLEEQKQKFIARMQIIEKLQRSRPEIVHVFDELVRTLPDGTYLTNVKQTGARLKIQGVAQSSTRVSTYMRNIDASQWLRNPELEVVKTEAGQQLGSSFTLFADQYSQVADEEASKEKGAGNKARTAQAGVAAAGRGGAQ